MFFRRREEASIEVQLAPMADIGFLLICFFIVTSRPPRYEAELSMTLPGSISDEVSVELPEELRVAILADGTVEVNEGAIGQAGEAELEHLVTLLKRFKESADANQSEALITVDAANDALHQRIIDVLNACGKAGIRGVTLADDIEEGL